LGKDIDLRASLFTPINRRKNAVWRRKRVARHFPLDLLSNGKLIKDLACRVENRHFGALGNHPAISYVVTNITQLEAQIMKLTDRMQEGVVVLEPKGKIMGGPDASLLHDKLYEYIKQDRRMVVVDLAQVDWMNSTGLGILISGYTTLRNNDGLLKLANVTDKIQSLLTITKLVSVFEAFDSVDDAVKSFK
jgi:anti-sigma B factor antagonist